MIWKEKRMVTSANTLRLHLSVEPIEIIQNINFEGMSPEDKEKLTVATFTAMKARFTEEFQKLTKVPAAAPVSAPEAPATTPASVPSVESSPEEPAVTTTLPTASKKPTPPEVTTP